MTYQIKLSTCCFQWAAQKENVLFIHSGCWHNYGSARVSTLRWNRTWTYVKPHKRTTKGCLEHSNCIAGKILPVLCFVFQKKRLMSRCSDSVCIEWKGLSSAFKGLFTAQLPRHLWTNLSPSGMSLGAQLSWFATVRSQAFTTFTLNARMDKYSNVIIECVRETCQRQRFVFSTK